MHTIIHYLSSHLLIVWPVAIIAGGLALTCLLLVVLRQPGTRAAPRSPRRESAGQWRDGLWQCPRCQCLFVRAGFTHEPCGTPASGLTDSRERIWLPSTLPPLPRPPQAASAPRIRPQVVPLCERIGAYYVRADTPVARVLSQSGWRSWD
jgi:hypothetical protein